MFKKTMVAMCAFLSLGANSAEVPIEGTVASKCIITTDVPGVYGNPTADKLSTDPADGGVTPIIRYDVVLADSYKAKVTTPTSFTSSPSLTDSVTWVGSTSVEKVSDTAMAGYETAKVVYNETTEFDLTQAGSVWFKTDSSATYGGGKALPGGSYKAVVVAECIAK